jgi:hypothetical protein
MDGFNKKSDTLLEKLRSIADGKTQVVMGEEVSHMTLDIIASVRGFCWRKKKFSFDLVSSRSALERTLIVLIKTRI